MKIGKGTSSVLGTPLNLIVFVALGFLFGFLSAISFNQVPNPTKSQLTFLFLLFSFFLMMMGVDIQNCVFYYVN